MSSERNARSVTFVPLAAIPGSPRRELLARYFEGEISAHMALMYLLKQAPDVDALRDHLVAEIGAQDVRGGPHPELIRTLLELLRQNDEGCRRIAGMLSSGVDSDEPARNVEAGIVFCRNLFDWSVGQSSESSVALYSLGSAEILDSATAEVVAWLRDLNLIKNRDLLEIGCGIGRFQEALSGEAKTIIGIDVSAKMIDAARLRCTGIANVSLLPCSGRDLSLFGDQSFDLVLAIDSFPYLVQSGMALAETHFAEAKRVLRSRGDLVILEFSYREDSNLDVCDVQRLAAASGFAVRIAGTRPFKLWDAHAFYLNAIK